MKCLTECHGKEFLATINGTPCRGKIFVEGCDVYLCQDLVHGYNPSTEDLFGFKYSYWVESGDNRDLEINNVESFKLIEELWVDNDTQNTEKKYKLTKEKIYKLYSHFAFVSISNQPYNVDELEVEFEDFFKKNFEK